MNEKPHNYAQINQFKDVMEEFGMISSGTGMVNSQMYIENGQNRQSTQDFQMININLLSDEDYEIDAFDNMSLYKAFGCLEVGSQVYVT